MWPKIVHTQNRFTHQYVLPADLYKDAHVCTYDD